IESDYSKLGDTFVKTLFVSSYPRFLAQNWLSPIINLDQVLDISIHIQPIPTELVLKKLMSQLTGVESEMMERNRKGLVRDPLLEAAYKNIEELRDRLQTSEERMFRFGLYIILYGKSENELQDVENEIRSILESKLVYVKPASFQQDLGIKTALPLAIDALNLTASFNTSPLASTFPFVSFDLSDDKGILYGINRHNSSLILFDRFSLENANTVVLGKSGGGKSYTIKLEILRSMMFGTSVIVIDPEREYKYLAEATGGSFFEVSLTSGDNINPFDIPVPQTDEKPEEVFRANIITLLGLLKLMLGSMTPEDESTLNEAIEQTYAAYDITPEIEKFWEKTPPLMGDLKKVLDSMRGGENLAKRLEKYTDGVYSGFLNEQSNIDLDNKLVVFSIRDMEDELRPIAMYIIIDYIWSSIRRELKKRILAIDEAWWMLQHKESASFLFGIAKRARKYFLGVTTISQDIADFLSSDYGKAIIANSSLQLLMKQSPTTIDHVQDVFNLTDEEKFLLLENNVGEGLFFAGTKHVAIRVVSSYIEDQIITSDPAQILEMKKAKKEE
ncbi:MAG: conjugal transfer protein TraC, partial [Candidatus Spechtbacteria bacterium RIFCSPLOWO2_02_FULL_38_8]